MVNPSRFILFRCKPTNSTIGMDWFENAVVVTSFGAEQYARDAMAGYTKSYPQETIVLVEMKSAGQYVPPPPPPVNPSLKILF